MVTLSSFGVDVGVEPDAPLLPAKGAAVSRLGDLWLLEGGHKLFNGSARESASYAALLGSEEVQMVLTDPPYGCAIKGHVSRSHGEFVETPDLRREIMALSEHWQANATVIEDTELGRALLHDLRRTEAIRPVLQRSRYDKEARLLAQSARFKAGQVHLPREASWLAVYMEELLAFPNGRHDNQVDSTSQALNWLTARVPIDRPMQRRNIARR